MQAEEDLFHLGLKLLLQNSEGEVLLLKKKTSKGPFWDLPGGRIQKGESKEQALKREVFEEIGKIKLGQLDPLVTFPTEIRISTPKENVGLILSVYFAQIQVSFQPTLSSEHDDFAWFSLEQVISLFENNYPKAFIQSLQELKRSIHVV